MGSRIDCVNIKQMNCQYYDDNRLCPDDCEGFVSNWIKTSNKIEEPIEESIEPVEERIKRKYTKHIFKE